MKKTRMLVLVVLCAAILLMQLQPVLIRLAGGVAGSFGVRPTSHRCLGFVIAENEMGNFHPGEIEFTMVLFHFQYSASHEDGRSLCVGQDVWYGE